MNFKTSNTLKSKVRGAIQKLTHLMPIKSPHTPRYPKSHQSTLNDYYHAPDIVEKILPIEAAGDPLIAKEDDTIRIVLQNPNGIRLSSIMDILPEVEAIDKVQADIAAFPESKLSELGRTKETLQSQLRTVVGNSLVFSASAPKMDHNTNEYQPGGALLALTGKVTGHHLRGFCDPWGRFTWSKLRGNRGEGLLIISAYRVSQLKGTTTGQNTAFLQQIGEMIKEELNTVQTLQSEGKTIPHSSRQCLDPRDRILKDLKTLITAERANGFRPILCIDANEDWSLPDGKDMKKFILECNLADPLYDKHHSTNMANATYIRGRRRLDFILVDKALTPSIRRIGSLGTNEAMRSDHVMIFADFDESALFDGLVNRPVRVPCREYRLAQADKKKLFIDVFTDIAEERQFARSVYRLAASFAAEGPTPALVRKYNNLDKQIQQRLLEAAKATVKKKFGYKRSPELGEAGAKVHLWKSIHSATCLNMSYPEATHRLALRLGIDIAPLATIKRYEARIEVRNAVEQLRFVQYHASLKRQEWFERNAEDIARAAGAPDWRAHMEKMLAEEKEREMNRKLTAIAKGSHQSLDWIEVPIGEWFYSHSNKEIYHYSKGVFEAHAAQTPSPSLIPDHPYQFYSHHHLKVPADDIRRAQVRKENDCIIIEAIYQPQPLWRKVIDPAELEGLILERNSRHLQQASIEEGRVQNPLIQDIMSNHGTDLLQEVLDGTIPIPDATDEFITAWIHSIKQTEEEKTLPPITGNITPQQFQDAFKAVSEQTSSSPSGLHYTIWKTIAEVPELAQWLSVMMSLPFEHGFVNDRWSKSIDVMLEKKPGVRKIHMLRIIGLLEADFNTALKILFSKRLMTNAERAGLNDEQWGCRPKRMALDPAMRNMMTFEYGRYMRITMAMFAADLTACFDRMFPSLSNIAAGKFGVAPSVLLARGKTIHALRRAVRTRHGVSNTTFGNEPDQPLIAGEYQGKGDVALLYVLQSSIVLNAHATLYDGINLPSPTPGPRITKRNDGYVDDVNTWSAYDKHDHAAVEQTMFHLQVGSQALTNLNETTGGSTAFHKCATQLLSWLANSERLVINYNPETPPMILIDAKQAPSAIKMLRPDQPNKGLGYFMAADGNQTIEYQERKAKVFSLCAKTQAARLTYREAYMLLTTRMIPQLVYGLYLSQFSPKLCQPLTTKINDTFLPILHVHRKLPRAIVNGPKDLGGLGLRTDVYNLQAQHAITYLVRAIRWDSIVAKDIITTLNACQLASGLESPLLEFPDIPIKFLPPGWIPHLRDMLSYFHIRIWVELAWTPKKQRQCDSAIMQTFATCPDLSLKELILANEFRMWLGIIMISELADPQGESIPFERIRNESEWKATPEDDFRWPNTRTPTDKHRAAFRKGLRLT